jgi:hypothetical protein
MSTTWYECKKSTEKQMKLEDKDYDRALVDALSYTEAESRINEEMSAYISEEFKITNIK